MSQHRQRAAAGPAPGLSAEDCALAVHGLWHDAAHCHGDPTPLWNPRVRPAVLRRLWADHAAEIREAAARAHVGEPWIVARLRFVAWLHQ